MRGVISPADNCAPSSSRLGRQTSALVLIADSSRTSRLQRSGLAAKPWLMIVPRRSDVRILTVLLAWIVTLLATSNVALAEPYPERYLTLIVPVTAGGAGDFMGRLIADRLSNALGEKVIVDNRGGAS